MCLKKDIKKNSIFSIVSALILVVIFIIILLTHKPYFRYSIFCSDKEETIKWFIECVNENYFLDIIKSMLCFGILPIILSSIGSIPVICHKYSDSNELKLYRNMAKVSFIIMTIYEALIVLISIIFIVLIII